MSRSESDAVERLRELLAKAESEDRLAPVFVYGVTVEQLRELLALHDEAVRLLANSPLQACDCKPESGCHTAAVRAFLAKASDARTKR